MITAIISWFVGVKEKLIAAGIIAVAIGVWLLKFKWQSEKLGAAKLKAKIEADNHKVQNAWHKIDNDGRSVDDAVNRLRKRSTDAGYRPEP